MFAVPVVAALSEHPQVDLVAVVTAPQRVGSRGQGAHPPVAVWSHEHGLATLRPSRLRVPDSLAAITELAPELLVLADYGQIVSPALLELPRHGALNLHPSLLPRHRGATPIPAAILAGDAATGVSLMLMDAGLDTGPLIAQSRVALDGGETATELEDKLSGQAARLVTTTLGPWLAGDITPEPQDEDGATLSRPLRRADGRIDPAKPALDIERQIRAYQPWPGSFIEVDGNRLVIWRAHPVGVPDDDVVIGDLYRTRDGLIALRVSDAGLALDEVQPASGRRMTGAALVRGRPALIGAKVDAPADSPT